MHFCRTSQGTEACNAGVPQRTGDHGNELITNETGIVFVTFNHLTANQLSGDNLKQMTADAGIRFLQKLCQRPRGRERHVQHAVRLLQ